jgi:hypothetical protein
MTGKTAIIALMLVAAPLSAGLAATALVDLNKVAGVYTDRFRNALVSGETYMDSNTLAIIPLTPERVFFSTDLHFYNGHTCGLSGIATIQGRELVFREKEPFADKRCVLRIQPGRTAIRMEDSDFSCSAYCGVRGSFNGVSFPMTKRKRLTASDRAAMEPDIKQALSESE